MVIGILHLTCPGSLRGGAEGRAIKLWIETDGVVHVTNGMLQKKNATLGVDVFNITWNKEEVFFFFKQM